MTSLRIPMACRSTARAVALACAALAVGGSAVAATLAEALERRAGELGCATLHTHLLGDRIARAADPLHRAFAAQGHRAEATRLCKRLPQGTA